MNDRPFVLVNVAMTADGKLDSYLRKGATISSGQDKTRVDQLRAKMDAILVGGKTLVQEDPELTVRSSQSRMERVALGVDENPAKVGIVTIADIKHDGDFMSAGSARRLIYTTDCTTPEQASVLEAYGAKVFFLGTDSVDLPKVMESLYQQGIHSLLVEGGGTLIAELLKHDLVDELSIYIAPRIYGGASSPTLADGPGFSKDIAPKLHLESMDIIDSDGGILLRYTVMHRKIRSKK